MRVTVVYAMPTASFSRDLDVAPGTTVGEAIEQSGVIAAYPTLESTRLQVGIFARRARLDSILAEGDRVEIYRPLMLDPMAARRSRATLGRARNRRP